MLKKNLRLTDPKEAVEFRIGDAITIKLKMGEKNVQIAIDAPKDMTIRFPEPSP